MQNDEILRKYASESDLYWDFTKMLHSMIEGALREEGCIVSAVNSRTKTYKSLEKKISEKDYNELSEITDISGIRIITFLKNDETIVKSIVEKLFDIDRENSVNKIEELDDNQFGYLSIHLIIQLKPQQSSMTGLKKYAGLKAEVQIRTILQHAWAEIEHDSGYKSEITVPTDYRREFTLLAGQLEMADNQFQNLTDKLLEYKKKKNTEIKDQGAYPYEINTDTLKIYLSKAKVISNLMGELGPSQSVLSDTDSLISSMVIKLAAAGYQTIDEVNRDLNTNYKDLVKYAKYIIDSFGIPAYKRTMLLVMMIYLKYYHKSSLSGLEEYFIKVNINPNGKNELASKTFSEIDTALGKKQKS